MLSLSIPNPSPHVLSPLLAAHNSSVLDASFRRATHTCPICITRLQGTHCMALSPCAHVACRSCLGKFWGSCIAEGDVDRVGCPDPECVKEARHASVEDVKAVVSPQEAERWQWLLRKQEAEQGAYTWP
jgi:E3 ubiquitin-protein ligase RNF14